MSKVVVPRDLRVPCSLQPSGGHRLPALHSHPSPLPSERGGGGEGMGTPHRVVSLCQLVRCGPGKTVQEWPLLAGAEGTRRTVMVNETEDRAEVEDPIGTHA